MRGVKESDDTIHPTKIKMLSCPRSTPLYVRHQPQAQKAYVVRSPVTASTAPYHLRPSLRVALYGFVCLCVICFGVYYCRLCLCVFMLYGRPLAVYWRTASSNIVRMFSE